ncbi:MAG: sn-glycerol-3-phosphate ABC transporter ATP-binding protein UgpC [Bacilli bacterium]|nr:sn-glycerol-3-phosphate ABC transporter ATP-binding protein UgpC [Bacilli bacterium]
MAGLNLIDVCKVYKGNVKAVNEFNLEIKDGEFLVFVGPSGCGKSTTLRMIAGLEDITSGKIYIGDTLINDLEPKDRDIAMVFQNYALYPHLSVYDNLAYSLNCHHEKKDVIKTKVDEVSKMLGIEEFLLRKPKELSGGQRQRVALGRCLIRNPKVFLFDEPLSNLDAKLRVSMRSEISKLHKRVNGTFIYVTHDQTEAMTMGDRIVVMKNGFIQQVDTPVNLYEHPANVFVATFLGSPQTNIFKAHLKGDKVYLDNKTFIKLSEKVINKLKAGYDDQDILLGIRPSDFTLGTKTSHDLYIPNIELTEKLGNETLVHFKMVGREESTLAALKLDITDDVEKDLYLKIDTDKLHLFNLDEQSILSVNETNYVQAKISVKEDDALIDNKFIYKDFKNRCYNEQYLQDFEGYVSIPSNKITTTKIKNGYELEASILAFDIYSDKKVYYAKTGKDTRITFFTDKKENHDIGEKINLYVDLANISICNNDLTKVTVNEEIMKPLKEVSLKTIKNDYYIFDNDKDFCKNKYFVIDKIFDLNNEMIINVKNDKNKYFSFKLERDTNLYAGMIIYTKYQK